MIHAAVADIICPAVAAEDPLALLCQEVFLCNDVFRVSIITAFKSRNECFGSCAVQDAALEGIQILLAFFCSDTCCNKLFYFALQALADRLLGEFHTIAVLSSIFEQGVAPCRALALLVERVRCGR